MGEFFMGTIPPVQFVDLGAIRLAYYESGPAGGLPIVLCHGFPELAYSWRWQLEALSSAGWWVLAPDLRGYGLTSCPTAVEAYDTEALISDLEGLLHHKGAERAILAGHDWGGDLAWQMALRRPERIAGVMALNTPLKARAPIDPIEIMRRRMGEEMYIVHFQIPGVAETVLNSDIRKTLGYFFRRPKNERFSSRGYDERIRPDGSSPFPLVSEIEAYEPVTDSRGHFLTSAEFQFYVDAFNQTGFTGGINWYRNITRNWKTAANYSQAVRQPSLMILAERDPYLPPIAADGMEALVPDLEKSVVLDSGHWTQQEQPRIVSDIMLSWLNRRMQTRT